MKKQRSKNSTRKKKNPIYNNTAPNCLMKVLAENQKVSLAVESESCRKDEEVLAVESAVESWRKHEEIDRISELPDDVLVFILSFLTFRDATATKILSSRWGRLHAPANIISLGFPLPLKQRESEYGGYIQSAQEHRISYHISRTNRVLDSYKGGHRIDKFKIDIPSVLEAGLDFEKWLEFALSRDTDTIDIRMIYGKNTNDDSVRYFSSFMEKSTLPGLKYLKELSLSGVYFNDYENLLTKFVSLERLSIESPQTWDNRIDFCDMRLGSIWKLKHLKITNFAKVSRVIVYQLMNLVSLRCHGLESYDLCIENVPKLVDMSIVKAKLIRHWGFIPNIQFAVYAQLLRVRLYILLDHEMSKVVSYTSPKFTKVKHMELDVAIDGECSNHQLFPLIQTCPSMEELEIKFLWSPKATYKYRRMDKDLIERKAAIDKLKIVRLSGYRGSVSELEFVLYVVKNATNLKDLIIVEDGDGHKNHAANPPKKFITRAFKHLRSAIPTSVNFISL